MMPEWNYIVIAMSFLLCCFLLWKEITRAKKSRLVWRIMASVLAVICLACVALPVSIKLTKTVSAVNEAILLAEGYDKDSVQKFLTNAADNFPVYSADRDIITNSKLFGT